MITVGTGFTSTAADLADWSSDTWWTPSKGLKRLRAAECGVEEGTVCSCSKSQKVKRLKYQKETWREVVVSSVRVSIQNTFENQIRVELGAVLPRAALEALGFLFFILLHLSLPCLKRRRAVRCVKTACAREGRWPGIWWPTWGFAAEN